MSIKFDDTCSELASIISKMYDHDGESRVVWGFGGNSGSIYLPDNLHKYDFSNILATQDEGGGLYQAMQTLKNCINHFMGKGVTTVPLSVFQQDPFNRKQSWSMLALIEKTLYENPLTQEYKIFKNMLPTSLLGNTLHVTELNSDTEGFLISYYPTLPDEHPANLHLYVEHVDNDWCVAIAGMPEQEGQRKVTNAVVDNPQPVNKSFQEKANEIMTKQKKVKSDHLLDEFMQAVLHLGDGTTTEVSKDSSGFTHVTCGTLSYRFTRCNSTIAVITQIADMIADDDTARDTEHRLAIYQDQCFGSRGKPQLLNQKRVVIKQLCDKLTARDIVHGLSSSYELVGNWPNFSIKLALSAIPEIIFIEVYPPHSLEGDQPIIIVTVDLKSMGCLMAFMQMDEQNKQSAILPWEDEPQHQGSVSQNWVSNNPKPEQKPGTLFLLEQNGDDDCQRINSVRKRLANTFNTLEVDIFAELQIQEKLPRIHKHLLEQIKDILLQGKSVVVWWRSDAITGELSSLSNFATKVLEWVEMARSIKAPHYYIGKF